MGEAAIDFIEQQMMERGYLDSREMANMFNLLRSNDLIWANVVNNYLLGEKPPAFDLLYWNSDGTRMARAAHSWYLRNTYVENNLIKPGQDRRSRASRSTSAGSSRTSTRSGAEKDHIVPWDAAWRITQLAGGEVRFVAGLERPHRRHHQPARRQGRLLGQRVGKPAATAGGVARERRGKHEGSWWTDWIAWLAERSGEKVKPPPLGSEQSPVLQDAPGSYVLEK